jgi:hypothetical protein
MDDFIQIIDFTSGEKYENRVIPFDALESSLDSYPGLYSWYIRPKPNREKEVIPIMETLLHQSRLEAHVKGNMRLEYKGFLEKTLPKQERDFNHELLRRVFMTVPMPLYIGISIDLKVRLGTHLRQLEETDSVNDIGKVENDSDEESGFFAARINNVFKEAGVSAKDCLYVRVLEYKNHGKSQDLSKKMKREIKKELEDIEYLANSLFNPIFGRR